jgi:hypothetical protein
MPENKKISDLVDDTNVTLSDYVPVVTSGSNQTKKATVARILSLGGGSGGGGIADAVFQSDFEVNLPANDTGVPNGTTIAAGESISSFLQSAFRKASHPVYVYPAAELSANAMPAQEEVGTVKAITFTETYIPHDGGAETSRVVNKNSSPLTPVADVYSDNIVLAPAAVNYQAAISYADGHTLLDSLGNNDTFGKIYAGTVISNTLTYQGNYKVFWGATDTAINAGNLRTILGNGFLSAGATVDFPTGATYRNFYVAVPPGHTLNSWVDFTSSSASLLGGGAVSSTAVTIADGGSGTLNYTLYKLTTGAPYSGGGNLFKFNIG